MMARRRRKSSQTSSSSDYSQNVDKEQLEEQGLSEDGLERDEEVQEPFEEGLEKDTSAPVSKSESKPEPVKGPRIAICPQCGAKAGAYLVGTANKCGNCSNYVTFLAG